MLARLANDPTVPAVRDLMPPGSAEPRVLLQIWAHPDDETTISGTTATLAGVDAHEIVDFGDGQLSSRPPRELEEQAVRWIRRYRPTYALRVHGFVLGRWRAIRAHRTQCFSLAPFSAWYGWLVLAAHRKEYFALTAEAPPQNSPRVGNAVQPASS
jgi:hypothetical protein